MIAEFSISGFLQSTVGIILFGAVCYVIGGLTWRKFTGIIRRK